MFRVMNEYLSKIHIVKSSEFIDRMDELLKENSSVEKYCITENYNNYAADIHLKDFSVEAADHEFRLLQAELVFAYSSFFLRYNEGDRVRYRLASCNEVRNGFYMDILFS